MYCSRIKALLGERGYIIMWSHFHIKQYSPTFLVPNPTFNFSISVLKLIIALFTYET